MSTPNADDDEPPQQENNQQLSSCRIRNLLRWRNLGAFLRSLDSRYSVWEGKFHQGPSMKVPRRVVETWLGVIDGKIYVIGGGCDEKNHVEFDPESKIWKLLEKEKVVPPRLGGQYYTASLEHKVYMVETGGISVYIADSTEFSSVSREIGFVTSHFGISSGCSVEILSAGEKIRHSKS
ncbi:unnamed protein product [Microthlaspi erraticum]|uniref:Uncharacterized protein n=1 Tax=Microthlaspi erraticum TaxID=1685480 RepID=A0A6D2KUN4_9BRAS|nr:unnamed protein product [Microthlaspi erraticum]